MFGASLVIFVPVKRINLSTALGIDHTNLLRTTIMANDIRDPDVLREIGKLVSSGVSYTGIAEQLKTKGIETTAQTVKRVYDQYSHRTTDIIAGDKELKAMIKADVLGVVDQLKAINAVTWDIINDLQAKQKQPDSVLKALREIRGQLELNVQLSERLTNTVDFGKVNKVELTQNIVNIYEKLKKDGYGDIKICPKCLDQDESVLIDINGVATPKSIKDVNVGDFAWGNGKILNKWVRPNEEGIKITLMDGKQITTSKDHEMIRASLSPPYLEYIDASKLNIGDLIPVRDLFKNGSEVFDKELLWLLGFYIADGCKRLRHRAKKHEEYYCVSIGYKETELYAKVISILNKSGFPYHTVKAKTVQNIWISTKLNYLFKGVAKGALYKNVPEFVFGLDNLHKEYFLMGYFSGDGNLAHINDTKRRPTINFTTISKRLASDIVLLFASLGIHVSMYETKRNKMTIEEREVNCHNIFRLWIREGFDHLQLDWGMGQIIKNPLKKIPIMIPIKSIESVSNRDMIDIEVEGSNKFYTSFGILTKNCGYHDIGDPAAFIKSQINKVTEDGNMAKKQLESESIVEVKSDLPEEVAEDVEGSTPEDSTEEPNIDESDDGEYNDDVEDEF